MSEHSYVRIWTHVIFQTKNLRAFISRQAEPSIHEHLRAQFNECGCPVHIINGTPNHIHALILLNPMMTLTDVVKQVKGNTSYWINQQDITKNKFSWEKGFAGFGVGDREVLSVFKQIQTQKKLHRKMTFQTELDRIIAQNGLIPPELTTISQTPLDPSVP